MANERPPTVSERFDDLFWDVTRNVTSAAVVYLFAVFGNLVKGDPALTEALVVGLVTIALLWLRTTFEGIFIFRIAGKRLDLVKIGFWMALAVGVFVMNTFGPANRPGLYDDLQWIAVLCAVMVPFFIVSDRLKRDPSADGTQLRAADENPGRPDG